MKIKTIEGLYTVLHQHYATDRYVMGSTIIEASNKQDAMDKLNKHLATMPDGAYTAKPCEDIAHIHLTPILS